MPSGVPVAAVAVGNSRNAGLLAIRILASSDLDLQRRMESYQAGLSEMVKEKDAKLRAAHEA